MRNHHELSYSWTIEDGMIHTLKISNYEFDEIRLEVLRGPKLDAEVDLPKRH